MCICGLRSTTITSSNTLSSWFLFEKNICLILILLFRPSVGLCLIPKKVWSARSNYWPDRGFLIGVSQVEQPPNWRSKSGPIVYTNRGRQSLGLNFRRVVFISLNCRRRISSLAVLYSSRFKHLWTVGNLSSQLPRLLTPFISCLKHSLLSSIYSCFRSCTSHF